MREEAAASYGRNKYENPLHHKRLRLDNGRVVADMTETPTEKKAQELLETAKVVAEQLLLHSDGKGLEKMRKEISETIGITVNGKIDKINELLQKQNEVVETHREERLVQIDDIRRDILFHNEKHDKDMVRIMPVILAFESGQRDLETAKRGGKLVLWLAATITAIGGAILVLKSIFNW